MRATLAPLLLAPLVAAADPPGGERLVPTNTQPSLVKVVGDGFDDLSWAYPKGLLPAAFNGLTYVSGPEDADLPPKAAWRKPVALTDKGSGAEVRVNCYRRRKPEPEKEKAKEVTPFALLTEPDATFVAAAFHERKAATASADGRAVFAFVDGDLMFKVVATGGTKPDALPAVAKAAAEAIWASRHPK